MRPDQVLPLQTERLSLRAVRPDDGPFFFQLYADWRVAQWLLRTPTPFNEEHARAFVAHAIAELRTQSAYTLVIEAIPAARPVGLIVLRIPANDPERFAEERVEDQGLGILGYTILPDAWGQRYASESAARMLGFAFDTLGLDRVQASPLQANIASRRILERLGFTIVEADILEEPLHGGPPQRGDCYLLRRAAWLHRRG
ncbi:MAG: GNAT family N-acetyltransferase [Blastochloris sp.]|nr:GNAT family N-acetyltransferase [Blastochloris sp.]